MAHPADISPLFVHIVHEIPLQDILAQQIAHLDAIGHGHKDYPARDADQLAQQVCRPALAIDGTVRQVPEGRPVPGKVKSIIGEGQLFPAGVLDKARLQGQFAPDALYGGQSFGMPVHQSDVGPCLRQGHAVDARNACHAKDRRLEYRLETIFLS